jgi:threonine synthase
MLEPWQDARVKFNPKLSGLACFACGAAHDYRRPQNVCSRCRLPLRVDYALEHGAMPPGSLVGRAPSLWRYREVLPIDPADAVTLVEGYTPLIQVQETVWVKDEARNPTGSFKARGMAVAVSLARGLGARSLTAPSAGNAASALAAYAAAAKLPSLVAMPEDTPRPFIEECRHYGAEVRLVPGTIADAGAWLKKNAPAGAFDVSTLKEPYRIEGKKTMAYELFEQFDGKLPDAIVYPTGGGTGLVGMWKAFSEMERLGWIGGSRPRLVSVQAEECAPVEAAWKAGKTETEAWTNPHTQAYGLRVPSPIGGFLCLHALRETRGHAVAIPEPLIASAARDLATLSGLDICPEGGAAWAATRELMNAGWIAARERVVVFNTGTGLKYR